MTNKTTSIVWVPDTGELIKEKAWIEQEIADIGMRQIETLTEKALKARQMSYSPYSHYQVGAAVLTTDRKTYDGTNIERASYSETLHGEESAITAAVLDGAMKRVGRRFIKAIAVSHPGDSAPCGHCRQIMAEHCDNCLVIVADDKGNIRRITSLKILFPYGFTPTDLGME